MEIFIRGPVSRSTRTGSGQTGARNGYFLIRGLLAGTPELALGRPGPEMDIFIRVPVSRSTRTGSGQTGARNDHVFINGLLAGAPELALARLGPEMVIFSLGAH